MADGVVALMKKLGLLEDKGTIGGAKVAPLPALQEGGEDKGLENSERSSVKPEFRDNNPIRTPTSTIIPNETPTPSSTPTPFPTPAYSETPEDESTPTPYPTSTPVDPKTQEYFHLPGPSACDEVGECPPKDLSQNWADPVTYLKWYSSGFFTPNEKLRTRGELTDLEAMAQIVDKAAELYGNDSWDTGILEALSQVFSGAKIKGPDALIEAALFGEPDLYKFRDTGFHNDFRDRQDQVYHAWPFVVSAANGAIGEGIALTGNKIHEIYQNSDVAKFFKKATADASLNDYVLSLKAIEIGGMIASGEIQPGDLGDILRQEFGESGIGSDGQIDIYERKYPELHRYNLEEESPQR